MIAVVNWSAMQKLSNTRRPIGTKAEPFCAIRINTGFRLARYTADSLRKGFRQKLY